MPHKDPEAAKAYKARWYLENRDRLAPKKKELYSQNRARRIGQMKQWRGKQHRLRFIYQWIRNRCFDSGHDSYPNYGGRGISMCNEWCVSFDAFKAWALMNGWKYGLQIDRIDNNGDYEPSNCRFVTNQINSQKRRTSKLTLADAVEIKRLLCKGKLHREIADQFGVSRVLVSNINTNRMWRNACE